MPRSAPLMVHRLGPQPLWLRSGRSSSDDFGVLYSCLPSSCVELTPTRGMGSVTVPVWRNATTTATEVLVDSWNEDDEGAGLPRGGFSILTFPRGRTVPASRADHGPRDRLPPAFSNVVRFHARIHDSAVELVRADGLGRMFDRMRIDAEGQVASAQATWTGDRFVATWTTRHGGRSDLYLAEVRCGVSN